MTITTMKYLSLKDSIAFFFSNQVYTKYKSNPEHIGYAIQDAIPTIDKLCYYEFIDKVTWINSAFSKELNIDKEIYDIAMSIPELSHYQHQMLCPYRIYRTKDSNLFMQPPKGFCNITAMDWLNSLKDCPLSEQALINKLRFEEFVISVNQPSVIAIVHVYGEEIGINRYATDNGIPNLLIPV